MSRTRLNVSSCGEDTQLKNECRGYDNLKRERDEGAVKEVVERLDREGLNIAEIPNMSEIIHLSS